MLWTIAKAVLLVTGLFVAWVSTDLLWRRVFGCSESRKQGGCGKGCMCTRRFGDDGPDGEADDETTDDRGDLTLTEDRQKRLA